MKKFVIILIVACLLCSVAVADDLSSMSFDELISLRNKLNTEIMSRPEWKYVEVPSGEWIVGVDIPAGYYSVTPVGDSVNFVCYDTDGRLQVNLLCIGGKPIGKVELKDGWKVKPSKPVYLAPPMSLDF